MFGNSASPTKEDERGPSPAASVAATADTNASDSKETTNTAAGGEKRNSMSNNSGRNSLEDNNNNNNINHNNNNNSSSSSSSSNAGTEKKRRSSGVAKASALFASAKQSLHLSHASSQAPPQSMAEPHPSAQQSALAKLGKTDAALSVPQGSLNNSAGESHPGPRSTFKVGVTEDKNKKCRRTMEDTHAYLYNFLSTPSPALGSESDSKSDKSGPEPSKLVSATSDITETDNGYFAIFDGHAGTFAADWCGKKLHVLLEEIIRANPNSAIPELLDQTFTTVDQQLQKLPLKNSGCTAICAVLRWEDRIPNPQSATGSTAIAPVAAAVVKASETPNNPNLAPLIPSSISSLPADVNSSTALPRLQETASRQRVLYTANVGDARIVLCRNGKALRLSYDHKGSDENEGRRVTNAGGLILNNRVNGVLAVTRALGDAYMKELVTGHPYTTETVIQPDIDEFLILACDGLWDVCSDQDAVDLIRHTQDPQLASKQLVDHALARFSTDNLSCMVVRFDNTALKQTIEQKKEPIGVDGDPASVRGGISEADAIVKEARKSLSLPDGPIPPEEVNRVSKEIIREEEEKEPGPELDPEGHKKLNEIKK